MNLSPNLAKKFECKCCDYNSSKESDYKKHLATLKHQKLTTVNPELIQKSPKLVCSVCSKEYKSNVGLWKHKKKCAAGDPETSNIEVSFLTNLVIEVFKNNVELQKQTIEIQKQNTEYQKQNQDFQKQMLEACKGSNSNNHINSHNKTFNMQVFLNEQCKDAMNIMDFVNSMTLELSDLEDVGEVGYVEGISKIIIRKLNELDVCKRPIHCSDFKREIMYVKDMDVWSKENSTFDKIRKAIKYVTKKNGDLLIPWIQKYPTAMNIQHPHNDIYMRIMNQAMGGRESFVESENKIIRKISKAVQIDKYNKC
jgi:hypothetical protein